MRVALAQLNPIVGDIAGNTARILEAMTQAQNEGAEMMVTAEMAVIGYPPRDLLFREGVVERCEEAVQRIAAESGDMAVFVGHPRFSGEEKELLRELKKCRGLRGLRGLRNSVSVCQGGRVIGVYDKRLLPGYDIFDEDRYFDGGKVPGVVEIGGKRVGMLICEDMWQARDNRADPHYAVDPVVELAAERCDLVVCLNATPFEPGKEQKHVMDMICLPHDLGCPLVMVNQVGANDDLIFDGRSKVAGPDIMVALTGWEEKVEVVDLDHPPSPSLPKPLPDPQEELYEALVLGVRDYVRKTGNKRVILGLSGGIDSALTAVIAARAIGAKQVTGVIMPSRYSSEGSIEDAEQLAKNLGMDKCRQFSIEAAHEQVRRTLGAGLGDAIEGLPDENVQARLRGMFLMAISNATPGMLVLATGNKSELAVGYSTLYGDMCGAISVIGDLLKKQVYELAEWINENFEKCGFERPPIPMNSISKPPSAELRPDQTDQDSLPPYPVLDEIIRRYVESQMSVETIVQVMPEHEKAIRKFTRMIDQAQYKREQAAVILKVSQKAFGRGRVMPVVMK